MGGVVGDGQWLPNSVHERLRGRNVEEVGCEVSLGMVLADRHSVFTRQSAAVEWIRAPLL